MKSLRLKNMQKKSKAGVASFYVVIFATILFGVIVVSFTRIILSESTQSSNDDLSRSAYDSALAGVEDAKIMVNRYYTCLSRNSVDSACESYKVFSNDTANCESGFPLAAKMHGITGAGEVLLQETSSSSSETAADQAYTCVLIKDVTPDYRGTLTSDTQVKAIPISVNGSGASYSSANINDITDIEFSWYSDLNQGSEGSFKNLSNGGYLYENSARTTPPTLQLTLIKTTSSIDLSKFHKENNDCSGGSCNYVYSSMVFVPSDGAGNDATGLEVSKDDIVSSGNVESGGASQPNHTFQVKCFTTTEFACTVRLKVADIFTNSNDNGILFVTMPYGDPYTDFAVTLKKDSDPIQFHGAQISVDSTGRTNQLYRRVEVRLDPADLYYPYPMYALTTDGPDSEDAIKKNFYVTANCWYSQGGSGGTCNQNGNL